jgi:Zn-dependent metalloprotease
LILESSSAQSLNNQETTIFQQARIILDNKQNIPLEVRFEDHQRVSVSEFFEEYKKAFAWSDDNKAILYKEISDDLGQTHYRFKQYYKGIELAEVQYLLHEKGGFVVYAHGKFIHGLNLDVTPALY